MNAFYLFLTGAFLAVSSWVVPQPKLSHGLLVVYGGQQLIQANADWHSYSLVPTHGCGLASISPAMLGQLAWVSVDGVHWQGPCLVIDVAARGDALESIFVRHEIAEISWTMAADLGFDHGAIGYVYFGNCPYDPHGFTPQAYLPPFALDVPPLDWTPSFYPYPKPNLPDVCSSKAAPRYPRHAPTGHRQAFLDEWGYRLTP